MHCKKGMVLTLRFPSVRDLKLISHLIVKIRHLLLLMSRKISLLFSKKDTHGCKLPSKCT